MTAELATALDIDDATAANWLHELQQTLLADLGIATRRTPLCLAELDDIEQQAVHGGHPKLVASKGRLGWGLNEFARFAPESGNAIQLRWLAVTQHLASEAPGGEVDRWGLPPGWLDENDLDELANRAIAAGARGYRLLPVHPWQWQRWVAALFRTMTIPLYHLLCAHGVGFIAHGQNVAGILRDGLPVGALLKDFHVDLRLAEDAPADGLDPNTADAVKHLPAEHLLHDLYTGHLVTALRFVGDALAAAGLLAERRFYATLVEALREHQSHHPELAAAFRRYDLLRPRMARVCVNRALLAVGYDDRAERPLPVLGRPLDNPLYTAERANSGRGGDR